MRAKRSPVLFYKRQDVTQTHGGKGEAMKTKDAAKIIKELAVKNCTSESEIRREMKLAILE